MANKKISQLNRIDGSVGITSEDLFPIASGYAGTFQTAAVTSKDVATYCLSPMPVGLINQPIGFTGNVDINFSKTNWDNASTNVDVNPYLQVRLSDGQLVTGSGVAVPAALGDNMGNCVATTDIDMQGFDITGLDDVEFKNNESHPTSFISNVRTAGKLRVQAGNDLFLSGNRHVTISGQALSLEEGGTQTPISGNVIITGGNLEIDPANKLIVNEIDTTVAAADYASLNVRGAIITPPNALSWFGSTTALNWEVSNIAQASMSSNTTFNFNSVGDGQTLTMYAENTNSSDPITGTFLSGSAVIWGAEFDNTPPAIAAGKTNLCTFVRINTGIFASAVTGYVY